MIQCIPTPQCFISHYTVVFVVPASVSNEARLYKHLFTDYNKYVRPRNDSSQPVEVALKFDIYGIGEVVS